VRVGMEATGYSRWFERLLAELGFEVWIGDPAENEAQRVKKRKTDREDARLLLRLMREDRFPKMVEVLIDEMSGSDRSRLKDYRRAVVVGGQNLEQPRPLEGVAGRSLSKKDLTGPTSYQVS